MICSDILRWTRVVLLLTVIGILALAPNVLAQSEQASGARSSDRERRRCSRKATSRDAIALLGREVIKDVLIQMPAGLSIRIQFCSPCISRKDRD
jgi:hypothetical protein